MSHLNQKLLHAGLLAGAALFSHAALAADNGIYLGAGVVRSTVDPIDTGVTLNLDDNNNGFKVIAGVRPLDWLAVEASYIDFGKIRASSTYMGPGFSFSSESEASLKGVDAFAVFLLDVRAVDFYAKVGGVRWQSDSNGSITTTINNIRSIENDTDNDSGFDLAYGVGVQARLGSLAARLEYEQFKIEDTDKVSTLSLGVTWTFL